MYNNSIFLNFRVFVCTNTTPYFSFCVYNYSTFFSQFLYKYSPLTKTFVLLSWLFSQHSFRVWYSSSLSLIWTLLYFAPSFFGLPIQFSFLQFVRTRTEPYRALPSTTEPIISTLSMTSVTFSHKTKRTPTISRQDPLNLTSPNYLVNTTNPVVSGFLEPKHNFIASSMSDTCFSTAGRNTFKLLLPFWTS